MREIPMIDITRDIHSLTDFKRKTNDLIRQMKETGQPVVLTVNGKAEIVVQDAKAYQRLMEVVDRLELLEALKEGLDDVENGQTRPAREALEELRVKHGVSG
jgi:prevent-host-death family protein